MKKTDFIMTFVVLMLAGNAFSEMIYDFDDGTFAGWQDLTVIDPAQTVGPRSWVVSPPNFCDSPQAGVGHVSPDLIDDGIASWPQDEGHPTLLLRSPEFNLTGTGDLTVWLNGGDDAAASVAGLPVSSIAAHTGDGGVAFMGVALRNTETGIYDLSAKRANGNNADWEQVTITAGQLATLDQNAVYTLDLIDSYASGWGWVTMDTVSIAGDINTVDGDMDGDGDVEFDDLVSFSLEWSSLDCDSPGNFDEFCGVDFKDFAKFFDNWLFGISLSPYDPSPYDGQSLFPVRLSWQTDIDFATYDVYLGTSYNDVLNADNNSPEYKGTVSQEKYTLGALPPELPHYWRVDGALGQMRYAGPVWNFSTVNKAGWKVVDTQPGEWIMFEDVYLTSGNYRFSGRMATNAPGKSVQLGASLGSVSLPDTGGDFQRFHLGHINLSAGYYDIKFFFETGGVDLDWIFAKKDASTSNSYLVNDTVLVRASESGHPILGTITGYEFGNGLSGYSDTEYELPIYNFYDRDTPEFWDMLVDELLLSRVNVVMMHGRGCTSLSPGSDSGIGNMCPRLLRHLVDAIDRTEGARETLRLGMWDDTGPYAGAYRTIEGLPAGTLFDLALDADSDGVGDVWKYMWDYNMKIWFDTVPSDLWYRLDGRPVIAFWGPINMTNIQGNASRLFAWLRTQFINRYGEDPHFNVTHDWTTKDTTLTAFEVQAAEAWFIPSWYPGTDASYSYRYWNSEWWGCAVPAFRDGHTLPGCGDPCREVPRLSGDVLRDALSDGVSRNARFTLLEGWTDIAESAGYYRSNEWDYPNQYINIVREFSDFGAKSMRFEAEACDFYSDTTSGNSGGQYRDGDLDILKL